MEPSPTELQELYNAFGYILTEEQTISGADVSDIDLPTFRAYLTRQGFDVVAEPQPAVEGRSTQPWRRGRVRRLAAPHALRPSRIREATRNSRPKRGTSGSSALYTAAQTKQPT